MDMSQHFCDLFVGYYIIAISNFRKHLTLHYMVFCLKNHIKSYVGQYFLSNQANHDLVISSHSIFISIKGVQEDTLN
jgi:hypothetical protein